MPCSCTTFWRQDEKKGTAKIKLTQTSYYDPPQPTYTPPPPVPIGGYSGSWIFKRNVTSINFPRGTTTLSSDVLVKSKNAQPPWSVDDSGSACDCINTNNGKGTEVNSTPLPNEIAPDDDFEITKSGKWQFHWTYLGNSTGYVTNGPEGEQVFPVKTKYTLKLANVRYKHEHSCPGATSTATGDFETYAQWKNQMKSAGQAMVNAACD